MAPVKHKLHFHRHPKPIIDGRNSASVDIPDMRLMPMYSYYFVSAWDDIGSSLTSCTATITTEHTDPIHAAHYRWSRKWTTPFDGSDRLSPPGLAGWRPLRPRTRHCRCQHLLRAHPTHACHTQVTPPMSISCLQTCPIALAILNAAMLDFVPSGLPRHSADDRRRIQR